MADKPLEVWLQTGELLWTEIQPCRALRFPVFAFTNAVFTFLLQAYEYSLGSFSEDYSSDEINHEWTRMFSRAERALECGGLTPLFFPARGRVRTMSDDWRGHATDSPASVRYK